MGRQNDSGQSSDASIERTFGNMLLANIGVRKVGPPVHSINC
jgi:hypothetical protein